MVGASGSGAAAQATAADSHRLCAASQTATLDLPRLRLNQGSCRRCPAPRRRARSDAIVPVPGGAWGGVEAEPVRQMIERTSWPSR